MNKINKQTRAAWKSVFFLSSISSLAMYLSWCWFGIRFSYGMRSTHFSFYKKKCFIDLWIKWRLNKSICIAMVVGTWFHCEIYAIGIDVGVNGPYATKNLYDFEVWIVIFGKSITTPTNWFSFEEWRKNAATATRWRSAVVGQEQVNNI